MPKTIHRVPAGLDAGAIAPSNRATVYTRSLLVARVVGFVCLTPDIWVRTLHVGRNQIGFSTDGFPSEAACAPGIFFPALTVQISEEVSASFENSTGAPVCPRSYFLFEIEEGGD